MKPFLSRLIVFSFSLFLLVSSLCAADKYALIVGISNYKSPNWPTISSDEDVILIKNALLKQGFKQENIAIITDEQCTREGILKAIGDNLTAKVKAGDVAIFHFSGHGQRIYDSSGMQQDGYDQSLVCYDARDRFHEGEADDKHLRGADLGKALMKLREKLGSSGNLLVVLDACHSGNGTRGLAKKRGVEYPYAPTWYNPARLNANSSIPQGFGLTGDSKSNGTANMVCFYACSPHQANFEFSYDSSGKDIGCGSLSYALQKELTLADSSTSYRALWDRIRADMASEAPSQTPQEEGNLDCKLFGGHALPHVSYYSVVSFSKNDFVTNKTVWINCGTINGIATGTTVAFYSSDTRDTLGKKPMCTGTVSDVRLNSCIIKTDKIVAPDKITSAWVYLKNVTYGLTLSVRLPAGNAAINKSLKKIFSDPDFSFISAGEGNADVYLDYKSGKLIVFTGDESPNDSIMNWDETKSNALHKILLNLAKWKFTKTLNMTNPADSFGVKILPLQYTYGNDRKYRVDKFLDTNKADITLHANGKDGFQFEFTNYTDHILYINVIDIQPDGKINMLVPNESTHTDVVAVYPHKNYLLHQIFSIGKPYGNEITKFICSDTTFDLSPVFASRKVARQTPFEKLYNNVSENKTRGPAALPSLGDEVAIKTLTYTIEP